MNNRLIKRGLIFYGILMFCLCAEFFAIASLTSKENLQKAATNQQSYKLKIADLRGTIYDCRNVPMVNLGKKLIAAVIPSEEALQTLTPVVKKKNLKELYTKCSGNIPFTIEVEEAVVSSPNIRVFEVPIRYEGVTLAAHILGYINSEKKGVTGLEKAFEEQLNCLEKNILVKYSVDARCGTLPGGEKTTIDKSYFKTKGVVLELDSRIQALTEEIANKYIKTGTVIVTEVPNCEIKACANMPSFLPQSIGDYLYDKTSPMLNRAFCEYNIGSIFKLVTSAAALENEITENFTYNCKGSIEVDKFKFKCFNGNAHEKTNMQQAISKSCNSYFVELTRHFGYEKLLKMCKKLHLGEVLELAPGFSSAKGVLPSAETLSNPCKLAVFSFGQGKLLTTPIQIAGLINAVASGGIYSAPKLLKGLANEAMEIKNTLEVSKNRAMSEHTADLLKEFMRDSVVNGTAKKAKSESVEIAGKTGTAQTGILDEKGKKIEQSWFAGFFPYKEPKYAIIVLAEDGFGGGESCGPVFKELAEKLTEKGW